MNLKYSNAHVENSIKVLMGKFNEVKNMGYIKTMRKGSTGVGYTFETLLGKNENTYQKPDFAMFEIKTLRESSKRNIHLFNATPKSDNTPVIKNIISKFGYPKKNNKNLKCFNISLNSKDFVNIGNGKRAKISIEQDRQKIELLILDIYNNKIPINCYWQFNALETILNNKLQFLTIVTAKSKYLNSSEYFHYDSISFYKLKNFSSFISVIESGDVRITFKISEVIKNGKIKYIHDHGTDFSISYNCIKKLFDEI